LSAELRADHDLIADQSLAPFVVLGRQLAWQKFPIVVLHGLSPALQIANQMTVQIDHLHTVYGHGSSLLMDGGFPAQCLIEKTALFKLAHDAVVDQALERDIADFWIALLHKTLNVLQSIEYNKRPFVGPS